MISLRRQDSLWGGCGLKAYVLGTDTKFNKISNLYGLLSALNLTEVKEKINIIQPSTCMKRGTIALET